MSKTLDALSTQLTWQLSELNQNISIIEQQLADLNQQYESGQQRIMNANDMPATILPEQEMARLQFILHQQQLLDKLNHTRETLRAELNVLQARQLRLKTELKRLELYQEQQRLHQKQQAVLTQYKQADEWSLLHGEPI